VERDTFLEIFLVSLKHIMLNSSIPSTVANFGSVVMLVLKMLCGGGATRPLSRDRKWRYCGEIQQSGHVPRSGPEIKNEEVLSKISRRRDSNAGQSRRR